MAKKKKKKEAAGAPEWMVTYGDMMTLLLCFFVLIVSFSTIEPQKKNKFEAAIQSIKKALGMPGHGKVPTDEIPKMSLVNVLDRMTLKRQKHDNQASTKEQGVQGERPEVTKLRDGMQFVVGGKVLFEPGSAELTGEARRKLKQASELLRGYNNLVQIRGHTAQMEAARNDQNPYDSTWQLSHARAKAVYDYLTSTEVGLREERFRLVAVGDRELLVERAYQTAAQAPNRRVEVVVTEQLTREVKGP
jgi:chemotaxis protein MotB